MSFLYVCPEPVLVNVRFLVSNGAKKTPFSYLQQPDACLTCDVPRQSSYAHQHGKSGLVLHVHPATKCRLFQRFLMHLSRACLGKGSPRSFLNTDGATKDDVSAPELLRGGRLRGEELRRTLEIRLLDALLQLLLRVAHLRGGRQTRRLRHTRLRIPTSLTTTEPASKVPATKQSSGCLQGCGWLREILLGREGGTTHRRHRKRSVKAVTRARDGGSGSRAHHVRRCRLQL